jgi:uncharacterized SAM-binding protein YcdF (DUF218 family)
MASGTQPSWAEALTHAQTHTDWTNHLPNHLDSIVLALGCTLTKNEKELSTSSIVSAEKGHKVYQERKATGEKTALVMVGSGYFDYAQRGDLIEALLMVKHVQGAASTAEIVAEPYSYNTPVNALYTGIALKPRKIPTVYLVSDPLHAKRALKTFTLIWKVLGITSVIHSCPAAMPQYGNSNKWFLRSAVTWKAWNKVGLLVLPKQVEQIKKVLETKSKVS